MFTKGIDSLSNAELLTILIGTGTRSQSALELSQLLLNSANNSLNQLGKLTLKELQRVKGIGSAKATTIATAFELGRRRQTEQLTERPKITTSKNAFDIVGALMADLPHEEFWVLLLNRANQVISREKISQGGISGTVTDIRIIMKLAIDSLASGLILCHNHPSGNLSPSNEDIKITKQIKEACSLVEIIIVDHIIIGNKGYYSFADNSLL
jgi:DNA repair protein RadC